MENLVKEKYGNTNVVSSTLPNVNAKNIKFAGGRHDKTDIVFNERGMPIFGDIAVCDLIIPKKVASIRNRDLHFKEATKQLHSLVDRGLVNKNKFSIEQMEAILNDAKKIPGYTWHHHELFGRMQLVPEDLHTNTGHFGGFALWNTK